VALAGWSTGEEIARLAVGDGLTILLTTHY
jgi:hypothetical protein